jgi:dolichyl-phosphooligosaccharide-protein glycotransferase
VNPTSPPNSPRPGSWVALAAVLSVLALLVRALGWRTVVEGDRVSFFGADAYYHARRVLYTAAHFPETLRRDPYVNFPHGGEPIWSPHFDALAAALVRFTVGPESMAAAERLLIWIPPVLGAAAVLVVFVLARMLFGGRAALVAAALLAILPGHFAYTRLGYLDHHAAVSLASLLLVASAMAFVGAAPRGGRSAAAAGGMLGLVMGSCLLLWPGMLLHVGAVGLALLLWTLAQTGRAAVRVAVLLAGAHTVALAVVAPFSLGQHWERWGSFSPLVLSDFQPWLLATGAAAYLLLALLCARPSGDASLSRRSGAAIAAGMLALAPALLLLADVRAGAEDAWAWFARQEEFQAQVTESQPLLMSRGRFDTSKALTYLTPLVFLAPLWLAFLVREARRRRNAGLAVLAAYATVLLAATLFQFRFVDAFAPIMALCVGAWVPGAVARVAAIIERRSRLLGSLVVSGLLLLAVFPALSFHAPALAENLRALRGEPPRVPLREARLRLLADVGDWLREHTPPTSGFADASVQPEYGVLSHWSDGHLLRYVSRRPMVVDNFGDDVGVENFRLAHEFYLSPEERASQILDRLRVRYAVFEYRPIAARTRVEPDSVFSRLYLQDGAATEEALALRGPRVLRREHPMPALNRHRLVYETEPKPQSPSNGRAAFKVYEHVAGARIVGRVEPGATVEASLEVETPRGRRFTWRALVEADPQGTFALRVPYATAGAPPSVRTAPRMRLRAGSRELELVIPEEAVLSGGDVMVPERPAAPGGD